MFMGLTSLASLDITMGKIVCTGYLYISWTDEQLAWNSSDFNNLTRLTVSPDDIWTPKLVHAEGKEIENGVAPSWISNSGRITWLIGTLFEGGCILDVRRYPFDKHECGFIVQPSAYDASEIQLGFLSNASATALFAEHGEWEVTDSRADLATFVEPLSGVPFNVYLLTMTFSRRYLFVAVHTSIPYFLLVLLNTMIFVVPIRSGERVTFSMTILLAFIFFTSNISDDLPHNSLKLSYVSIGMASLNVATTLGIIASVILCRLDSETITAEPEWLRSLTFRYLRYRKRQKISVTVVTVAPCESKAAEDKTNSQNIIQESTDNENSLDFDSCEDIKWTHVANMLDYVLFYINFILMMVLGTCSIIFVLT